ncbi:MAG: SPOR domain-containing protein [Acidiferrobacterales bacterium]
MAYGREPRREYAPKHRIVGAIIIVSLAALFLPRILSQSPRHEVASPPSEIAETQVEVFRLPTASITSVQKAAMSAAPPAAQSTARGGRVPQARVKPAPTPQAARETAPKKTANVAPRQATAKSGTKPPAPASNTGWMVQVGTFSNDANVKRLRAALKKNGFLVDLQDVELKGQKAVRVRVGPFQQKRVALKAQSRIEKELGLKGVVLTQR